MSIIQSVQNSVLKGRCKGGTGREVQSTAQNEIHAKLWKWKDRLCVTARRKTR